MLACYTHPLCCTWITSTLPHNRADTYQYALKFFGFFHPLGELLFLLSTIRSHGYYVAATVDTWTLKGPHIWKDKPVQHVLKLPSLVMSIRFTVDIDGSIWVLLLTPPLFATVYSQLKHVSFQTFQIRMHDCTWAHMIGQLHLYDRCVDLEFKIIKQMCFQSKMFYWTILKTNLYKYTKSKWTFTLILNLAN